MDAIKKDKVMLDLTMEMAFGSVERKKGFM